MSISLSEASSVSISLDALQPSSNELNGISGLAVHHRDVS